MTTFRTALSLAGAMLAGTPAIAQTDAPPPPPPGAATRGPSGPGGGLMRADTNRDGVITRAEALAQADQQFDRMDLNKDGKVTADERDATRQYRMARAPGAPGTDTPPPPPPGAGKGPDRGLGNRGLGKRMDPNGDGAITREEFRARALQRFDRMDTNHDGRIDAAEIAAIRQRMMDRRGDFGPAPMPTPAPVPRQ